MQIIHYSLPKMKVETLLKMIAHINDVLYNEMLVVKE